MAVEKAMKEVIMESIELVKAEAKVITVQPGDIIAVKYPGMLSLDAITRLKEQIKGKFPDCEVAILCEGMDLEIYRRGS